MNCDRLLKRFWMLIPLAFFVLFMAVIRPFILETVLADPEHDCHNIWEKGEPFEVKLFLSRNTNPTSPKDYKLLSHSKDLVYQSDSIYGKTILDFNYSLPITKNVKTNVTNPYLWIVASTTRCAFKESFGQTGERPCVPVSVFVPAIRWTQKKVDVTRNLLTDEPIEVPDVIPFEPYFFANLSIDIIADHKPKNPSTVTGASAGYYRFSRDMNLYLPPIAEDKFWELDAKREFIDLEVNESLPMNIKVNIRGLLLWSAKLDNDVGPEGGQYLYQQWQDMKRSMIDTHPVLLWTTFIVTIAHVLLNVLAFKEDVSWWNSRESLGAISMQSLIINAFSQVVILLFLLDEDTTWVVRVMKGLNVVLEFWKITKLLEPIMEFPYFRVKKSYKEAMKKVDYSNIKYLYYSMIPILAGYAGYSLYFSKFKSLYSYALKVAVGAVYGFGFIGMLPQLYMNYKLKSVAGMSGGALAYKSVNTFIDDLFSFVMKMPMLHRIACFRDDIVFFIWLYQRHIYPTDTNRVNEFGEGAEKKDDDHGKEEEEEVEKKDTTDEDVPVETNEDAPKLRKKATQMKAD